MATTTPVTTPTTNTPTTANATLSGTTTNTTSRTLNLNKDPPSLKKARNYDDWVKLLRVWKGYTTVPPEKQALALLLSLEDSQDAQDAVLELPMEQLECDDGIDNAITKLDDLFKRDDVLKRYGALEEFELYKRMDSMSIQKYVIEFEKRLNKTKTYGTTWSDDLLAFRLLRSANLSDHHQQLAKATITDLTYNNMKQKLKTIFGEASAIPTASARVKVEDINYTNVPTSEVEQQSENYESFDGYLEGNFVSLDIAGAENTYYQN